jgi:hypothetical protein
VEVIVKVCQVKTIPDTIQSGLSEPLQKAVPLMAQSIAEGFFEATS